VKVIFAFIAFFAFMGLLVMGSCAYLAYRAKGKADRIEKAYQENDAGKLTAELGLKGVLPGTDSDSEKGNAAPKPAELPAPDVPKWKSYTGTTAAGIVPLKQGLVTVRATSGSTIGDYETTVKVEALSGEGMDLQYVYFGPAAKGEENAEPAVSTVQNVVTTRTVRADDLANAHEVQMYYSHQDPRVFPKTTSLDVSKEVFQQIKTKGETAFTYRVFQRQTAQAALGNLLGAIAGGGAKNTSSSSMMPINCTLRRSGAGDVGFPVILNEKPVELPAIFATCRSDKDDLQLYILDNENDPLVLANDSKLGDFHGQVIRINFPEDKPVNTIEKALQQSGSAQVYGIYFDFASATIRPQSKAVLDEIAKAMTDNPEWKLSIEGHTDNIGGDASNLELSKRRAAAVKRALTEQYRIAASRFTTAGFGASRPVDTNDTLEGRARNRRVELVRE
jgi:outer membrane protein OmpA-like peptidoglycan-associated protein